MNAFTNYLEKFGSNFLIAAMIPSLGLVVSCMVVFDPIFEMAKSFQIENGINSLLGITLFVTIPTILIGFTLTTLNTFILKFFEGYVFLRHISFMRNRQVKKAEKLIREFKKFELDIELIEQKNRKSKTDKLQLEELKAQYFAKVSEYDQNFPPPHAGIMPTKFGNILKASEAYAATRYGIDAVEMWPRLWHVIPPSYKQTIEEARNELSFLVNMFALSLLFYTFCILALITNAPRLYRQIGIHFLRVRFDISSQG